VSEGIGERLQTQVLLLADLGSPVGDCVRKGHDEAQTRAAIELLELAPNGEILEWFSWFDGFDCPTTHDLFAGTEPLTFDQCIRWYREIRDMAVSSGLDAALWSRAWFPIAAHGNEKIVLDLLLGSPTHGQVWLVDPHVSELTRAVAASLAAYLDLLIAETRRGAMYWDAVTGAPHVRDDQTARLAELGI
jgi:hypothetical protein